MDIRELIAQRNAAYPAAGLAEVGWGAPTAPPKETVRTADYRKGRDDVGGGPRTADFKIGRDDVAVGPAVVQVGSPKPHATEVSSGAPEAAEHFDPMAGHPGYQKDPHGFWLANLGSQEYMNGRNAGMPHEAAKQHAIAKTRGAAQQNGWDVPEWASDKPARQHATGIAEVSWGDPQPATTPAPKPAPRAAGPMTFTDNTGQHSTTGHITAFDHKNGVVRIKKENGNHTSVPLERLSPESREQAYATLFSKQTLGGELRPDLVTHAKSKISKPIDRATAVAAQVVQSTKPAAAKPARQSIPSDPMDRGVAAFDAVQADTGGDFNESVRAYAGELIASGVQPEEANRRAVKVAMEHGRRRAVAAHDAAQQPAPQPSPTSAPGVGTNRLPDRDAPPGGETPTGRWARLNGRDPGFVSGGLTDAVARQRMREEAEAARRAAEQEEHFKAIGAKYGPENEALARESFARTGAIDFRAVQTPHELAKNEEAKRLEWAARNGDEEAKRTIQLRNQQAAERRKEWRERVASAPGAAEHRRREADAMNTWVQRSMEKAGNMGPAIDRRMAMGTPEAQVAALQTLSRLDPQNAHVYAHQVASIMGAEKARHEAEAAASIARGKQGADKPAPSAYARDWMDRNSGGAMSLDEKQISLQADLEAQGVDRETAQQQSKQAVDSHVFNGAARGHMTPDVRQHLRNMIAQIDPATGAPKMVAQPNGGAAVPAVPLTREQFAQEAALRGLHPDVGGRLYDEITEQPRPTQVAGAAPTAPPSTAGGIGPNGRWSGGGRAPVQ